MKKVKIQVPISENQSMLVSDFKQNQPTGSCNCERRVAQLEDRLQMMTLKLDELSSNVNISFTKHMETYSKLVEQHKTLEKMELAQWESKQLMTANNQHIFAELKQKNKDITGLSEELRGCSRLLREINNWKVNKVTTSNQLEKQIYESVRKIRTETDDKIKQMFQAVEQIGLLQRKMLKTTQGEPRNHQRSGSSMHPRKSLPSKNYSICNQSTIIGNSRYYI